MSHANFLYITAELGLRQEKLHAMVDITKDKIVIEIATSSPAETLSAFQDAIVKLLHLKMNEVTDYTEVYYSTWLLQEMIPRMREI